MKRFSNTLSGRIELVAVSLDEANPIHEHSFWRMRPPLFLARLPNVRYAEIPLVFQEVWGTDVETAQEIHDRILPWFEVLDTALKNDQIDNTNLTKECNLLRL